MYNGELHTNVAAIQFADHFRVMGGNSETIIDIPEWAVAGSVENINLIMGRADWKLIAITYGEDYQLKPQDLVGLSCPMSAESTTRINNAIIGGEEVVFNFHQHIVKAQLHGSNLQYYIMACNPAEDEWMVGYQNSHAPSGNTLTNYSCDAFDETAYDDWFWDWLTESVGLQNPTAEYMGYMSDVELPIGAIED